MLLVLCYERKDTEIVQLIPYTSCFNSELVGKSCADFGNSHKKYEYYNNASNL